MTRGRLSGFTAIELMVTLAILAILLGIAVPSFSSFTENQRLRAASTDLRTDLTFARSEALKRNQTVSIHEQLQQRPELRLLYTSDHPSDSSPNAAEPEAALAKPFSLEDLALAVRGALDCEPRSA